MLPIVKSQVLSLMCCLFGIFLPTIKSKVELKTKHYLYKKKVKVHYYSNWMNVMLFKILFNYNSLDRIDK
jgi:hypothetical protein